ncbi:MAG TPA: DUF3489 domain-containing protein [Bryobacteraceae bacterium]
MAPFDELKPVRRFTNNKAAVRRVWAAIQRLAVAEPEAAKTSPAVAPEATPVAPEKAKSKKAPTKSKKRAPARKGADEPRTNKKAEVVAMMKRAKGATLAEIMETTGWQRHTVRGFVSILGSKGGEKIESSKNASGERTYKIA